MAVPTLTSNPLLMWGHYVFPGYLASETFTARPKVSICHSPSWSQDKGKSAISRNFTKWPKQSRVRIFRVFSYLQVELCLLLLIPHLGPKGIFLEFCLSHGKDATLLLLRPQIMNGSEGCGGGVEAPLLV